MTPPRVAQLVLFHGYYGVAGDVAAIVTAVHADGYADLTLFPPGHGAEPKPHAREGTGPGCWSVVEGS